MATEQEIKDIKAGPWAWRYEFDSATGVCLSVESRSLVERYPLYMSPQHNHVDVVKGGVVKLDTCRGCQAENRRGKRWRAYILRELGGK
jgi:hypothetical protein